MKAMLFQILAWRGNGTTTGTGQMGLTLTLPVYQGGLVNAQTRQANDQYQQALSNMEFTHRSVIAQTRNAYLGVIAGITQIRADQQAIISNQISLRATEASFRVGTSTMVDVLNHYLRFIQAEKSYSNDQYTYLINTLLLKQSAGTLNSQDIIIINSWLRKHVGIAEKLLAWILRLKSGHIARPPALIRTSKRCIRVNSSSLQHTWRSMRKQRIRRPSWKKTWMMNIHY